MNRYKRNILTVVVFLVSLSFQSTAGAYDFAVQPILPKKDLERSYKPLARYLANKTGQPIKFVAYSNFLRYWDDMKAGKFDLVMDAAHLVDYRIQRLDHEVLGKVKDKVSFSLVTTEDNAVLEPSELIAKRISCLAPPSRGNLQIDKFFPNPIRQPFKQETRSFREAIKLLQKGKVHASIIPTPMVGGFPDLYVVETTDLWPHMGVTAAPSMPADVKAAISKALLGMEGDPAAADVLKAGSLPGFEATTNEEYEGYMKLLTDTGWE